MMETVVVMVVVMVVDRRLHSVPITVQCIKTQVPAHSAYLQVGEMAKSSTYPWQEIAKIGS